MAEGGDSSTVDKENSKGRKRQEADGFDSYVDQTSSPTVSGESAVKLNNEMALDKGIPDAIKAKKSVENEEKSAALVDIPSTRKPGAARAGISSQKVDLRQQFRQLQNQELIRRILQSTGIPNNLTPNRSFDEKESRTESTGDVKGKDSLRVELTLEDKTLINTKSKTLLQSTKELETLPAKEENKEKGKLDLVSQQLTKDTSTKMQSDISFVCSKCDACKTEDEEVQRTPRQADVMNSSWEYSSVFLPRIEGEKEKVKGEEELFGTDSVSQENAVKIQNTHKSKVDELSERLQKQPNKETLDEILKLLQNQALMTAADKEKAKEPNESVLIADESQDDLEWRQQQQQKFLVMGPRTNLREKHSRQLADMKNFYEGEIGKLRDQLNSLRGNLTNLQEAIPVKMLEATNHKLDARCNLMEEIASELKTKSQKLEQNNEELEKTCFDLQQTNEALEMRCLFLQKSVEDHEEKESEIQNKNMSLESKILHLSQANEMAAKNCKQLEDSKKNFEKACKELELNNQQLEARFRKCNEENLKLSFDVRDLQASLQASRKHAKELESTATSLQNEKNDWVLKVDAAQKMAKAAQKRYEEERLEKSDKENIAKKLEEQMGVLTLSFENAAKAKEELEKNAERDRELLKRLLSEYDALAKENQKIKASVGTWTEKLEVSQDEINSLRCTITKLVQRNTNLEESLKDSLSKSVKSTIESLSPSVRKTWESPVPLKADKPKTSSYTSLSGFESIFDGKEHMTSSPMKSESKTPTGTPHKDKSSGTPQSIKFEIPWERQASTPTKHKAKRSHERSSLPSPDKQPTASAKSHNNLVIKKSDLVTRFDVVFEDSTSGEEVKRSRTGRTSRAPGESPTSIFVSTSSDDVTESSPNRLVSDAAEAALSAVRSGKVTSQAEWENKDTVSTSKERKPKGTEKKRSRQAQTGEGENSNDQQNVVSKLERKFSSLTEEKKRLESTLSRIPVHRVTKRSLEDKAFLEKRLDEVIQDIGSVRMQLRRHHAL